MRRKILHDVRKNKSAVFTYRQNVDFSYCADRNGFPKPGNIFTHAGLRITQFYQKGHCEAQVIVFALFVIEFACLLIVFRSFCC